MNTRIFVLEERSQAEPICELLRSLPYHRPIELRVRDWEPIVNEGARARWWVFMRLCSDHLRDEESLRISPARWHVKFKSMFLDPIEMRLPNGTLEYSYPSISEMGVRKFNDFLTQAEAYAAERGVHMEDRRNGTDAGGSGRAGRRRAPREDRRERKG